jgi:ribosomal protein S18 acetylase RimI-like enzyme
MHLTLRPVGIESIDEYVEIENSVAGNRVYSGTYTRSDAQEEFQHEKIFFVYVGDTLVGSVQYEEKDLTHAYISGIVIKKEFHGKGYGKLATKALLDILKKYAVIDLVTHPDNTPAVALYTSLGFSKGEILQNYFGDGEPRMRMVLER